MINYAGFIIVFAGLSCVVTSKHLKVLAKSKSHLTKSERNSASFLLFSDVHLDLMYRETADKSSFCRNTSIKGVCSAKFGRIGCDTPVCLLRNALSAMKRKARHLESNLDFILVPGDSTPHCLPKDRTRRRSLMLRILRRVSKEIHSVFPSIPFFPCIGNNDLPGHYVMPRHNDTWYSDLLKIWQDAILCKDCKMKYETTTEDELRRTFLYGGYYRVSIAGGTMTLLILNSLYWTRSTWRPDDNYKKKAHAQMDWMEEQLKLAKRKKKKVIISSHIAPGMDIYSFSSLWMDDLTERYLDLVVNKFSDVIAGQVYSHFHRDSFRYLSDKKKDPSLQNSSYILLMPSISPSYRNNPAFRFVHLDKDQQAITDYEQYYTNISRREEKSIFELSELMFLPVKSFGNTFHILVDLFKYDFWKEVVLHRVVTNVKWSKSDDDFAPIRYIPIFNLVMLTSPNSSSANGSMEEAKHHVTWQLDYKFSSRYPASGDDDQVINGKRIQNLSDNLINQSDDSVFTGYISSRQVRYKPDPYSRFTYYCALTCIRQKEFNACRKKYCKPKIR